MIKISKNKNIYFSINPYESEEVDIKWELCDENEIIQKLEENINSPCIIDDGVTLKDLFDLIEEHYDFFSDLIEFDLEELIKEIKIENTEPNNIKYIELKWDTEEHNGFLNELIVVNTVDDIISEMDNVDDISYCICFEPINTMKYAPLYLNTKYDIYKIDKNEDGDNFKNVIFSSEKYFTIFDILDTLIYELLRFGNPEQRDNFKNNILTIVENIDSDFDEFTEQDISEIYDEQENMVLNLKNKNISNKNNKINIIQEIDNILEDIEDEEDKNN